MQRRSLILSSLAAAVLPALAQDKWPSKPVTYIVPFPAGGTSDILERLIGQKLGPVLGTTIVVDNKGGAGGADRHQPGRADRRPEQPVQDAAGCAVRRKSQTQNHFIGVGRQRHVAAPGAGTAGLQMRHAVHPCALQGQRSLTIEQFSAFQKAEVDKWAQVIKAANIKLE